MPQQSAFNTVKIALAFGGWQVLRRGQALELALRVRVVRVAVRVAEERPLPVRAPDSRGVRADGDVQHLGRVRSGWQVVRLWEGLPDRNLFQN